MIGIVTSDVKIKLYELIIFREYRRGRLAGEKVTTRVGYAVDGSYGYSIIGVFGDRDDRINDVINYALTSFRLTTP